MSAETKVEVGQVWRREADRMLVRVIAYNEEWDDITWQYLEKGRVNKCYGWFFRDHYTLESS